jgi:hypothetical protein
MLPSLHLPGMEPRPLRQCDIRTYVANALIGFEARQAVRKALRDAKRKRRLKRSKVKRNGVPEMKSGITFRATFEQPIGPRNPAKLKLPGPIEVEIFQARVTPTPEWKARRPGTRNEFTEIAAQMTPATIMSQIEDIHFEFQLTIWAAYDKEGVLGEDEWKLDGKGQPFVTELRRQRLSEKDIHERAEKARSAMKAEDFYE